MTLAESRNVSCAHRTKEIGIVYTVDPSLIRDAAVQKITAEIFMPYLLARLDGRFKAHLERHPQHCLEVMTAVLQERLKERVSCLSMFEILTHAVGKGKTMEGESHIFRCRFCARDVRQIKEKLPDYDELRI